ncbi:AglZ/HisF2 family acetamidino modification protein [Legionella sp. W05-934-2]|uniref:AglZ/HisF2 family acetamidino modification protein n=1 Tax=Legionella sp. W05-934-2 TaxID=1198649 RepID=UPI00346194DF
MILPRVIPVLLLKGTGLYKGVKFKNHTYVGDPINAINIFNDKEVDELILLDILATKENRFICPKFVEEIAGECMMPLTIGGGITCASQVGELLAAGAEKVVINSGWIKKPSLVTDIAKLYGSQSVIISIDVKKNWLGAYKSYSNNATTAINTHPVQLAQYAQSLGTGEIMIHSIDRDGTMSGYDLDLIASISNAVTVPTIAAGGAGKLDDFKAALDCGCSSAVAAGSFFVFHGPRRAVLISYPSRAEVESALSV